MGVGFDTPLRGTVAGHQTLEKNLGLRTVGDLLTHYPRAYLSLGEVSTTTDLAEGELVSLVVEVESTDLHPYRDRRTGRPAFRTEVVARLGDGRIHLTWFDTRRSAAEWRTGRLRRGSTVLVSGRPTRRTFRGQARWELAHPHVADEEEVDDPSRPGLWVVYRVGGKLRSEQVQKAVRVALDVVEEWPERLPEDLRAAHGLVDVETAHRWVHRPQDREQVGAALRRLRFEEAFVAQVALAQRRHAQREVPGVPRTGRPDGLLEAFAARMPFALTAGQREVEKQITADLAAPHPMHRLLQGEVGSGKTVVAVRAMLRVVDSGGQAALLAPTEVLAQQHHRSVTALLGDLAAGGELGAHDQATRVALLTGSLPAAARRAALLQAASGEAGIVIGTHALLQEQVQFADLGLVVVDEQHRFGVEQRAALTGRSERPPHVLVMTATPIPRTVAMTVFGDLETSALTELPAGRSPIQTVVVPLADQPAWGERVWQRVREEVAAGRQAYVVCPRIGDVPAGPAGDAEELAGYGPEEPDADGGTARGPGAAVLELGAELAAGPLQGLRVEVLHGRLAPEDKDRTMRAFAAGEVEVLVCTTVVEVGVDVGNATTMVVLDADRFGVSQLHQLRGRVGRGGHPGLCLLVTSVPGSEGAGSRERLEAVASTTDGFRLAELDLAQRREGDVLGRSQSGRRRTLRLLSVTRDAAVIESARQAASDLVERDPDLSAHPGLRAAVADLEESAQAEYLEKT